MYVFLVSLLAPGYYQSSANSSSLLKAQDNDASQFKPYNVMQVNIGLELAPVGLGSKS